MRYPWVCLTICGIWLATIILISMGIVEVFRMYALASVTVLLLFILGLPGLKAKMFRLFYIIYILGKYGSIFILSKYGFKKIDKPKFLRRFFEEASGAFIKFGQLLAMRVDVVSREYSIELLSLLDNVKPFSYKEVERIFVEELGSTPDKIFW